MFEGAAAGLAAATILGALGWPGRGAVLTPFAAGIAALVAGAAIRLLLARPTPAAAALAAESAAPRSQNVIFTAFELSVAGATLPRVARVNSDDALRAYVYDTVFECAAREARSLDAARLFPARGRAAGAAAAACAWLLVVARATGGHVTGLPASATAVIDRVEVAIAPPAYTGSGIRTVRNPERVEVLEGSEVTVRVQSNADSLAVTVADSADLPKVTSAGGGAFSVRMRPRESGFVGVEAIKRGVSAPGERRLVGVTVVSDAPPAPRIVAPERDLMLADGHRTLDVEVAATDDIGLRSLSLHYTKASGSGEQYTFVEGEVPLTLRRTNATHWTGKARWVLDSLGLNPGDIVVYRATASDARPGSGPVESDAFIIEIPAPGSVAAGGFSIDPDDDRSALSQQMIVLKAERLLAAKARMSGEAFADSAAALSVEQRRVRAEFVFMMGGEVGEVHPDAATEDLNEEEEAAGESDLLAGREMNAGRIALRAATRAMSLVARELDQVQVASALEHAKEAVKRLEEAFSRNRILLRALAEREALDPSRRLSGALTEIARAPRPLVLAATPARVAEIRHVLADASALGRAPAASDLSLLAERVLRVDPGSKTMQAASAVLVRAASSAARGESAAARALVDDASLALARELRAGLVRADAADADAVRAGMLGRLVDMLRGRGR